MLAAGIAPFHYHNERPQITTVQHGLAVYLDVSGSVNRYLPKIIALLRCLENELKSIFLFSNEVVEVPFKTLLAGRVQTTFGTDFDSCGGGMPPAVSTENIKAFIKALG